MMALSRPSPTAPNEGSSPDERISYENTHDVNCLGATGRCNTGLVNRA